MCVRDAANAQLDDRLDSVVLVEPDRMGLFTHKLGLLNKKAARFGLEAIEVLESVPVAYKRRFEDAGRDGERQIAYLIPAGPRDDVLAVILLNRVRLKYPIVRLGDWQVVGKLEAVENGCLTFRVTDDEDDAREVRARSTRAMECEHCRKVRRRTAVFVLREVSSGKHCQVGKGCLKDFTGIDPAAALFLARMYELISMADAEADEFARSMRRNSVATAAFLSDVVFLADRGGFVSSAKAAASGAEPTWSEAARIDDILDGNEGLRKSYGETRDACLAKAAEARVWMLEKPEASDFDRNAKLLLEMDHLLLKARHLALAAAVVPVYRKAHSVTAAQRQPSKHVGTVGTKMEADLQIERVIELENQFSRAGLFLVLMKDADGNKLTWKSAAATGEMVKGEGRRLRATFKVKAHGDYQGNAQTGVSHLKVLGWLP